MSDPYVLKNGVFILKGGKAGSGVPLESHVIPHGNSSVGAKLDELNQNLTKSLTYNEDTDYFGMTYNGVWKNVIYAGFKVRDLIKTAFKNHGYTTKSVNKANMTATLSHFNETNFVATASSGDNSQSKVNEFYIIMTDGYYVGENDIMRLSAIITKSQWTYLSIKASLNPEFSGIVELQNLEGQAVLNNATKSYELDLPTLLRSKGITDFSHQIYFAVVLMPWYTNHSLTVNVTRWTIGQ